MSCQMLSVTVSVFLAAAMWIVDWVCTSIFDKCGL